MKAALASVASTAINGSIIPLVGDVTSKASLQEIADRVRKEHGFVNLVFANAGITGPLHTDLWPDAVKSGARKPTIQDIQEAMWKPSMEDFTHTVLVNGTAVFYTAIAFLDLLDAGNRAGNVAQGSQFLVTSSIAGFSRMVGAGFSYTVSKAAAHQLVKSLSTFLAAHQIRVNGISPGMFPSEMTEGPLSSAEPVQEPAFPGALKMPKEFTPAGRTGSEREFAGAVLYLVSQAGGYMNGEIMVIDGGRLGQVPSVY